MFCHLADTVSTVNDGETGQVKGKTANTVSVPDQQYTPALLRKRRMKMELEYPPHYHMIILVRFKIQSAHCERLTLFYNKQCSSIVFGNNNSLS